MTAPPRDSPPTFPEEILVLLLSDESGTAASISRTNIDGSLAAAVLMDLAFADRIDTDSDRMFVVDRTPTGNPLLDPVLARIAAREEAAETLDWLQELAVEDAGRIRGQAQVLLVRRRLLQRREGSFVWSFSRQFDVPARWWRKIVRSPRAGGRQRAGRRIDQRVREALLSNGIPDVRDAALIGLVETCGLLGAVVPDRDLGPLRSRIAQLRRITLSQPRLARAVADIERSVARTLAVKLPVPTPDCFASAPLSRRRSAA